jgi:beta-RFAP synthase
MTRRIVTVAAPSRLHFGMFSFGQPGVRQFGGVGAMISAPGVQLTITADDRLDVIVPGNDAPLVETVTKYVRNIEQAGWLGGAARSRIEVNSIPRRHVGLGSGTQLALAMAAGLNALVDGPPRTPEELAKAVRRGQRSAIGTHGFARGGLLVEAGKLAPEEISPLVSRVELPNAWRWVLVCPPSEVGLSGDAERRAFDKLPPVPRETTDALCRRAFLELVPAAATADFARFSDALYDFGHAAGLCFASQQAGAFASPRVAALVEQIRNLGIHGVAQTSWGPTIAALVRGESAANSLVQQLQNLPGAADLEITIAAPENRGAQITTTTGRRQ